MKALKANAVTVLVGLLSWLLGFAAFYLSGYLFGQVLYPALSEWAPALFPAYNPVLDREAYERLNGNINLASAFLAVFLISYFTVRFDNRRFEVMITETEGLYTLREGARIYFPRFFAIDAVTAFVMAAPIPVALLFIPEEMPKFLTRAVGTLSALSCVFTDRLGTVLGIVAIALVILAFRLLSGLISLSKWRAVWLSDISVV